VVVASEAVHLISCLAFTYMSCFVLILMSYVYKHAIHYVVLMLCVEEVCIFYVHSVILAWDVPICCNAKRINTF
jgi:hypothetical protein